MKKSFVLIALLLGCTSSKMHHSGMTSIQIMDRNGFVETTSVKDRLTSYEGVDFMSPQPYQRVVRVYGSQGTGKVVSRVTTYHPNGQLWQYLDIVGGRACGAYREWYSNGQLKIATTVLEGSPELSESAQATWLFDGIAKAFDEQGRLMAHIPYTGGVLEGISSEFFPSGRVKKQVPYSNNLIHGTTYQFDTEGTTLEAVSYCQGVQDGMATYHWSKDQPKGEELYQKGRLVEARYWDSSGHLVAHIEGGVGEQAVFEGPVLRQMRHYRDGILEGKVQELNDAGRVSAHYEIHDGVKHGDEWRYYPSLNGEERPKLLIPWKRDTIEGVVKTWYDTGSLESQREMRDNKPHGLSLAWFEEGQLMLMEEYERGVLKQGSYFGKWDTAPVSKVEQGTGVATLYDKEGRNARKIVYEQGAPQQEL